MGGIGVSLSVFDWLGGVKFEDDGFKVAVALVETRHLVLPVRRDGLQSGIVGADDAQVVQQRIVLLDLLRQLIRQLADHLVPRTLLLGLRRKPG